MDIQSSVLNELFVLYPVIIQGWVTPVKPDGIAHGGIPKVLYDDQAQGLECLIDPWTELQRRSSTVEADDRVDLYINDDPTPATGTTVKPGEETLRQRLYLPHGYLLQGVNRLHYKVIRASGNTSEDSRDLKVLYHRRSAENLDLVIPPDVIKDGVSAARAEQGVVFGFTYNNRRNHDRVEFLIGDTLVRFDVPDGTAPITHTLYTDTFIKAGDNPSAMVEFLVIDQLGNRNKSPEKRLDIHLQRLDLPAPIVKGQTGNNFSPTQPEVRVQIPVELLPSDKVSVTWEGPAGTPPAGSYTSTPRLFTAGMEVAVPRSVLAYSLIKQVKVTYNVERDGTTTPSLPLLLNILALPATALITPKIVEADANYFLDVLALDNKNATIHALLHTLIEDGQPCWLSLEGKKANGAAHNLVLWNGLPARVNSTWIRQGFWPAALAINYLKQLGNETPLIVKFMVSMDKSNDPATATRFPDRSYTIKALELLVPTLVNVLDASAEEVPEGTSTFSTSLTLKGQASKGQQVEIFDGSGSSAVSKGKATAHATTGDWEHTIDVPVGVRRLYAKALYAVSPVYSNVRNLTVKEHNAPTLDSVRHSGGELGDNAVTYDSSVTLEGKVTALHEVRVFDNGIAQHTAKADADGTWTTPLPIAAGPHAVYVKALATDQPSNTKNFRRDVFVPLNDYTNFPGHSGGWTYGPAIRDSRDITYGVYYGRQALTNSTYTNNSAGVVLSKTISNLFVGRRYEFSVLAANGTWRNDAVLSLNTNYGGTTGQFQPPRSSWTAYSLTFTAQATTMTFTVVSHLATGDGNDYFLTDLRIRSL
ncbi:hypothetical protein [Pseudomonas fluorescens]|uniref:Uncharacterized protein n=1 Tax=Pseudomonas fluorescens TaxID=294 RepID=A0A5E7T309_PSEFL|nr:hypothetical protein [Pseudomonas fluorescens]VVP90073.1 hypothetical protein PS941_01595 [Pseudomonas fluorescens]